MGTIRSVESMSLALLRLIGEEARKERTGRVTAQVPVDVATYLMNEKREWLHEIESRDRVSLVIVPNPHLQTPAYSLKRIRDDEKELPENATPSYEIPEQPTLDDSNIGNRDKKPQTEAPLVPSIVPVEATPLPPPPPAAPPAAAPVPVAAAGPQVGIFVRLWRFLFGSPAAPSASEARATAAPSPNERPTPRDARPDRYRERDRTRDRGRDPRREAAREAGAREGAREPRRDGRPRGDHRDNGRGEHRGEARRPDGPRGDGPRGDGPRGDGPRTDGPRADGPRADGPRTDGPRGDGPRSDSRVERADAPPRTESRNGSEAQRPAETTDRGERTGGERTSERGGRGRRRRGRGRREGGENAGNGQLTNAEGESNGRGPGSPAPRIDRPRTEGGSYPPPASEASSAGFSPTPSSPPPASPGPASPGPASPASASPASSPPPAAPPAVTSAAEPPRPATSEKYVVWSGSAETPRSGPDDR
jgi:ribonuclease E